MADRAAQKVVDRTMGIQKPDEAYATEESQKQDMQAIVSVGGALAPPLAPAAGETRAFVTSLATNEGAVVPVGIARSPALAIDAVTPAAQWQAVDVGAKAAPLLMASGSAPTKTPNAQIDAERQDFLDRGGQPRKIVRPVAEHHIATVESIAGKNPFTPRLKALFENAGVSMEDAANKVTIEGHAGPHGPEYNQPVLDSLTDAVKDLQPNTPQYREAFLKQLAELRQEVATPGSILNTRVTKPYGSLK